MNKNEKVTPSLELISGAYSSVFWSEIEDWIEGEDNPRCIYNALTNDLLGYEHYIPRGRHYNSL